MCRTREEIIGADITCQELLDFIEEAKTKLSHGGNGATRLELLQARVSLDTRIAQIQDREDFLARFDFAKEKSEEVKADLQAQLETCETNLKNIDTKLDAHIKDYQDHPSLRKSIAMKPLATLLKLGGLVIGTFVFLFSLTMMIAISTGFDVLFIEVVKKFLGQ